MRYSRPIDTLIFRSLTLMMIAVVSQGAPRAQTDQSETILAPVVRTERPGAGLIRIVYDLRGAAGTLYAVSLEASNDGGQTFAIRPRATTGDVGPGIAVGTGKAIAWDTSKDVEDLQTDRFVFRVVVSPAVHGAAPKAPATTSAPAGGGGAASKPSGGTTTAAKKGGGLSRAAILALAGGGAAAGVGVAVAKGKDSSGTLANAAPQNLPTRNFAGPYSLPLSMRVTNRDGSDPCVYALTYAGTMTLTVQVAAGSVTGTAVLQGTVTVGASTCINRFGMPGPTPGSSPAGVSNIPVTGTSSSLSFNRQLTSQGMTNDGNTITGTTTYSFSGTLSTDSISGTLTISISDESSVARFGNGSATMAVTLR